MLLENKYVTDYKKEYQKKMIKRLPEEAQNIIIDTCKKLAEIANISLNNEHILNNIVFKFFKPYWIELVLKIPDKNIQINIIKDIAKDPINYKPTSLRKLASKYKLPKGRKKSPIDIKKKRRKEYRERYEEKCETR